MKWVYHRGKHENLTEDDFSWSKNVIFIAYIFIIFLNTFQCGVLQYLEYVYYKNNMDNYNIVCANVIAQSKYGAGLLRFENLLEWKSATLRYEMDGKEFFVDTYSYPEVKEKQYVNIAVDKKNNDKIIRCIPYELTMDDQLNHIFGWGSILLFLCYLSVVKYLLIRRNKKRKEHYVKEKEISVMNEKKYTENDMRLQKCILDRCRTTQEDHSQKINVAKKELDIEFHKDFAWFLQCFTNGQMDSVLLIQHLEGRYAFVCETMLVRKYGLPLNYYVIAKEGEHYLCGYAYSSRMFMFSKNLGLTNTKYETIYHYVLECLDNRSITND